MSGEEIGEPDVAVSMLAARDHENYLAEMLDRRELALSDVLRRLADVGGRVLGASMYGLPCPWSEFETALRQAQFVLSGDADWLKPGTDL